MAKHGDVWKSDCGRMDKHKAMRYRSIADVGSHKIKLLSPGVVPSPTSAGARWTAFLET